VRWHFRRRALRLFHRFVFIGVFSRRLFDRRLWWAVDVRRDDRNILRRVR